MLTGDFGRSLVPPESDVLERILRALPVNLELAVLGPGMALLAAVPLAMWSARREGGRVDRLASPEMDALIAKLQSADTTEQRTDVLASISKVWQETVPTVSPASGAVFYPGGEGVHGVTPTSESIVLFHDAWKE